MAPHLLWRPRCLSSGTALASPQSGDSQLRVGRMDSTNHRHVTRVALGARVGTAASVLLLVLSACAVSHRTALDRVPLMPPSDHILAGRLAAADVVVAGVLTRAQRDIRHEAPPGGNAPTKPPPDETQAHDPRLRGVA